MQLELIYLVLIIITPYVDLNVGAYHINSLVNYMIDLNIYLLIQHNDSLTTISPTQMETFEDLAVCDVARFLYEELKMFEGVETVYANIDMKLSDLQDKASRREEVINYIKDSYVSASYKHQPYILTI